MKYPVFLFLSVILLSCQDFKKDGQIKELAVLEQKLDSIRSVFEKSQTDSTVQILVSVEEVELRIRSHYPADTIELELGEKINAYKMIRKQLKPMIKLKPELEMRISEEQKTLQQLKQDIDKAAGDKAKYDEYIAFERKKTTELGLALSNMLESRRQCFNTYERLHQEMEAFSMSLLN
jgi:hypothetical protein